MIVNQQQVHNYDEALASLKKHGKTFNFARFFLSSETGTDCAVLYKFCRTVDDLADESDDAQLAGKQLLLLDKAIADQNKRHRVAGPFLQLCDKYDINPEYGRQLIYGVRQDLTTVALKTEAQLIQYAYYVAGVVGLMMAPILGSPTRAHPHAIDLGIAMQLTNIARDILEDAHNNRRYVPGEWVNDIPCRAITDADEQARMQVQQACARLLQMAEDYYASGFEGLRALPQKTQLGMGLAASLYRQIGRDLLKRDCKYWLGRVSIPFWKKLAYCARYSFKRTTQSSNAVAKAHNKGLHAHLRGLVLRDSA